MQLGFDFDVSSKLIISLYDYTGEWAKPYIDAGYPVMLWDLKHEGDIVKNWGRLLGEIEEAVENGYYPYGLLSAPPCDDFAVSGARWFAAKDASTVRVGHKDYFGNSVDLHIALVLAVLEFKHQVKHFTGHDFHFWALENPVGRLETLIPEMKKHRVMMFDPCDYGDPYTKKTILWGQFNSNLKKTPVEPQFVTYEKKDGSIARFAPQFGRTGGKSEKTKAIRSKTPAGFAKAFFEANQ